MDLTLFVKGSESNGNSRKELGDCPFSHRIILILRLKGLDFNVHYVDPNRKDSRKWEEFIQKTQCRRKLPILLDSELEEPIEDSDGIADYLEEKFPEPKLRSENEEANAAGRDIFRKFATFMRNNEASKDETLRKSLIAELKKLNTYLEKGRPAGSFLDGDHLKHPDCSLLPRLMQVTVAGELKKFTIPDDSCGLVQKYLDDAEKEKAVKDVFTKNVKGHIQEGWKKKMGIST